MRLFSIDDPEFKCPCVKCQATPGSVTVDSRIITKLNKMQKGIYSESDDLELAFDMTISSSRRCEEHNRAVGGTPGSTHMLGLAVDIATGGDAYKTYKIIDNAMVWNFRFIEVTPTHVHLDIREANVPKLIIGK